MTYTYYIADMRTGQVLGDLPFSGVKLTWALSGTGTFAGDLAISDPEVLARGGQALTIPGRHAVYVDRDGDLLWAGPIWLRKSTNRQKLNVTGADYWSYFSRRVCNVDIAHNGDLLALAQQIFTPALDAYKPANLTVEYATVPDSPPHNIEYTYTATERKKVAEMIQGLAEGSPSFDFRQHASWTAPGVASIRIVVGRPYLGSNVDNSGALFDFPGNIMEFEEDEDGSGLVGRLFVRGSSDGELAPEYTFEDTSAYDTYPRYEDAVSVDEGSADVVALRGQYAFMQRKTVKTVFGLSVRADADPVIGTYRVGDDTRVTLRDPDGRESQIDLRIAEIELTPASEQVTITPWSSNGAS